MHKINIGKDFENALKEKYIRNNSKEWVEVYISNMNLIDITIVSNNIENRKEFNNFINEYIKNINKKYESNYKKGLIRKFTVEKAEEYEITKSNKKIEKPNTLLEAIEYVNNPYKIEESNAFHSDVISFYSYKGGVGRTLAIVHTAYLLAQKGKNVLLIDLDIEAPSLHNIFKKEVSSLKFGLIDYLYNKIFYLDEDNKIKFNDIYAKVDSGENQSFNGNLYVIPAGKISNDYIFKLSKIQPESVSKRNYLNDLIANIENKNNLNLDMVLIDSRTGLNQWGAISLLDVSDKVIFFTYPNNENIEGTKTLIELVTQIKEDNLTVVFSRGDTNGKEKANELFESLKLEQEYLEISYDSDIAIANIFPIDKMLERCEPIATLLLEQEKININKKYLEYKGHKKLLDALDKHFRLNNSIMDITPQEKQIEEENIYLVLLKNKELLDYTSNKLRERNKFIYLYEKETDLLGIPEQINIMCDNSDIIRNFVDKRAWIIIWLSYILYTINTQTEFEGITPLKGKEFNNYIEYLYNIKNNNECNDKFFDAINKIFQNALSGDKLLIKNLFMNTYSYKEVKEYVGYKESYKQKIFMIIKGFEWIKYDNISTCLEALKKIKIFFSENNILIDIKIFMVEDNYDKNKNFYDDFKSNTLYLEWKKKDIGNIIKGILNKNKTIFSDYMYLLSNYKEIDQFMSLLEDFDSLKKLHKIHSYKEFYTNKQNKFDKEFEDIEIKYDMDALLELFWGKRIKSGKFSKETSQWFFEKLKEKDSVNPLAVYNLIKDAIKIELFEHKNKENNCTDRLISFETLKKLFE
ncbi:cell division inhibitor MinD [Clostridium tepidiprofundi DSM 19306]|uniref:Cell division inhibitor MinD n=1 Tax=Clostridium tepidiprofundi DSM 19306 TaxID=1121338 RepID=A0A151ASN4_9CLOT|nr:AAA family ATPase [Clostridium tepidiprofundi]KYH30636.1 cell division inhibitor MinD [Clostridium tepidiprofundi DSM 19306]